MPNEIHTDFYSQEAQQIIGKEPNWVIRRGTLVIILLLLMILAGSWLIRYPDIISGTATISVADPLVEPALLDNGSVKELYFKNGDPVKKDQLIAVVEERYAFRAPVSGILQMDTSKTGKSAIARNGVLFRVTNGEPYYSVVALVPATPAFKITRGDKAVIKLNGYPYRKFGLLEARVDSITGYKDETFITVHLALKKGLVTSSNYVIKPTDIMKGRVDITGEEKSIFNRLFFNLINFF